MAKIENLFPVKNISGIIGKDHSVYYSTWRDINYSKKNTPPEILEIGSNAIWTNYRTALQTMWKNFDADIVQSWTEYRNFLKAKNPKIFANISPLQCFVIPNCYNYFSGNIQVLAIKSKPYISPEIYFDRCFVSEEHPGQLFFSFSIVGNLLSGYICAATSQPYDNFLHARRDCEKKFVSNNFLYSCRNIDSGDGLKIVSYTPYQYSFSVYSHFWLWLRYFDAICNFSRYYIFPVNSIEYE